MEMTSIVNFRDGAFRSDYAAKKLHLSNGVPTMAVTADLLKQIGMNVDMQLTDWGSVAARRAKKDPPAQGGWNLFHTSANGAQLASPLTSPSTITTCDGKNFPGWPCDQAEEDMRMQYIRETDPALDEAVRGLQTIHGEMARSTGEAEPSPSCRRTGRPARRGQAVAGCAPWGWLNRSA